MNGRTERTPKKEAEFLEELSETANVTATCKKLGIARTSAYEWRDSDPEFRARWDQAVERGTESLIDEAVRRGAQGFQEAVHYQGQRVDEVTKYSDTLLIVMLKARRPDLFKERSAHEHTGADGGPIRTERVERVVIDAADTNGPGIPALPPAG